jgi:hypothetical protein
MRSARRPSLSLHQIGISGSQRFERPLRE